MQHSYWGTFTTAQWGGFTADDWYTFGGWPHAHAIQAQDVYTAGDVTSDVHTAGISKGEVTLDTIAAEVVNA